MELLVVRRRVINAYTIGRTNANRLMLVKLGITEGDAIRNTQANTQA
jgi:hypothetical protein